MGFERDLELLRQIVSAVSQLALSITNAIHETTYDLNAAAFSETTNIDNDYEFDNVEFNFSTTEARTITITTADGTVILSEEDNTDTSFVWQPSSEMAFNSGENLTVAVTQFSSAGTMDCVLKVKSGTNTLLGDPHVGWIDTNGTKKGFQVADGRPRMSTVDYHTEISKNNLADHIHLWSFGENRDIDVVAMGEDLWLGPTIQIPHPLSAGEQMIVVSSNASDDVAGTGVRTIRIEYIDGEGVCQTEDITMDGTTPVNTVAEDIAFVNHIFATSVGSTGVAVGDIDIHEVGDAAKVYNRVGVGGNKSLSCILRIPNNKTYFITEWHCSISGGKPTAIRLRSTDWNNILYDGDDPVFLFKDSSFVGEATFQRKFSPPIKIPGGSTIKISAWATQANAFGSGGFNGYYE